MIIATSAMADILDPYRWEKRVILIHAPSEDSVDYRKQYSLLQGYGDALMQRDIAFVTFLGDRTSDVQEEWENAFHLNRRDYGVVLIGKDGTEKKRWDHPVAAEDIFKIIDAMPMRQRELNDGS
tara:strand:+ start:288 stop:659 length:372 start_codon:yes stop_codon:yes gene_type:complete